MLVIHYKTNLQKHSLLTAFQPGGVIFDLSIMTGRVTNWGELK